MSEIHQTATDEYEPQIVAFLDVLGFRTMTSLPSPGAEERIALIDRNMTKVAREVAEHFHHGTPFMPKLFSPAATNR
jgi:hypothetical protein